MDNMLHLWAILEQWVLGDGNYPCFGKNDKVNLAFYVVPFEFNVTDEGKYLFEQIKYAEYNFSGKIIYRTKNVIIVDTNGFKFYMDDNKKFEDNIIGKYIQGKGKLLVDNFTWTENINKYKNPPDIFYNLITEKIYSVKIGEKFINRFENRVSFPSSLRNNDITENDITEIEETIYDGYEYNLIEFKETNEQIEKTFYFV